MNLFRHPVFQRIIFTLLVLTVAAFAVGALLNGHLEYRNYRGLPVFAPFAVIVSLAFIFIAMFRPKVFSRPAKRSANQDAPARPKHSDRKRR